MRKQGISFAVFLLVVLSLAAIMILSELLPGSQDWAEPENEQAGQKTQQAAKYSIAFESLNYYTIEIKWQKAADGDRHDEAAGQDNAARQDKTAGQEGQSPARLLAEAGFPVVAWNPPAQNNSEALRLELGFSGDQAVLEPWLALLADYDQTGVITKRTFPANKLEYSGELYPELTQLLDLFNAQLRHLNRAADFFSHPWQELKSREITLQRLELLQQEADQCLKEMTAFLKENSNSEKKEQYLSVYQRLTSWQQKLAQLEGAKEEIHTWAAQQQASALVCQWQQLLWELGFL
jgi:hypothetical protein